MWDLLRGFGWLSLVTALLSGTATALEKLKISERLGTETGLHEEGQAPGTLALVMWRDRTCRARLKLASPGRELLDDDAVVVTLGAGTEPHEDEQPIEPVQRLRLKKYSIEGVDWLVLEQLKDNPTRTDKVVWPGGIFLRIRWADRNKAEPIELRDWAVYLDGESFDSRGRHRGRNLLLVLFAVSALLTPLVALKKDKGTAPEAMPRVDPAHVEALIAQVGNGPYADRQREMLRVWVQHGDPVAKVMIPGLGGSRKQKVWFEVRKQFRDLLADFDPLRDYRWLLE
jgi:hypothetical protein